MHYYNSLKDLIGNTPLVKLNHVGVAPDRALFAKLELMNPLGSVKDRTGMYMVEAAERGGTCALAVPSSRQLPAIPDLELRLLP